MLKLDKETVLYLLVIAIVCVWLLYPDVIFDAVEKVERFVVSNLLPEIDKASMSYLHWRGKAMKSEESKVDGN